MEITSQTAAFDIPENISLEAGARNPFLTTEGDMTLPLVLPPTANNFALTAHPERIDRNTFPPPPVPVNVQMDAVNKIGRMEIFEAGLEQGIDTTIYFDNGDFNAAIKKKKLNECNFNGIRDNWNGNISLLLDHLMAVAREEVNEEYAVFPIVAEYNDEKKTALILNDTETKQGEASEIFYAYKVRDEQTDGKLVKLPIGYRVTPFVKLHVVVDYVFKTFGYTLKNNPWAQDEQLKRLVFLNNTADACLKAKDDDDTYFGMLDYSQLLPTITVAEFIDILFAFGQVLYINGNERTAQFVAVADILNSPADYNFTSLLVSQLLNKFEKSKQLVLTAGTSIEGTAPTFDSFEAMKQSYAAYGTPYPRNEDNFSDIAPTFDYIYCIRAATGDYHLLHTAPQTASTNDRFIKKISPNTFNYAPQNDLETREYNCKIEQLTMDFPEIANKPTRLYPMYLISVQHFNSVVRLKDGTLLEEKTNAERKASLCFAYGRAKDDFGNASPYFYGSTQKYDNVGNPQTGFTLSLHFNSEPHDADGLHAHYFTEFEAFLKTASYIEFEAKLSASEIEELKLFTSKQLHNQQIIIESIDYLMGSSGDKAKIKAWIKR